MILFINCIVCGSRIPPLNTNQTHQIVSLTFINNVKRLKKKCIGNPTTLF